MAWLPETRVRAGIGFENDPLGVIFDGKRRPRPVKRSAQTITPDAKNPGIPQPIVQLMLSSSHVTVNGHTLAKVSVMFILNPSDSYFAGIHLWAKGYNGSQVWQLVTDIQSSPSTFYLEATGEAVTFQAISYGSTGQTSDPTSAPIAVVTL